MADGAAAQSRVAIGVGAAGAVAALWARLAPRLMFVIALLVIVADGTHWALSFSPPVTYKAEARVVVSPKDPAPPGEPAAGQPADARTMATQIQIARSLDIAETVALLLDLGSRPEFDPTLAPPSAFERFLNKIGIDTFPGGSVDYRVRDAYFKRLSVSQVESSWGLSIAFSSTDRKLAAEAANAVAERYVAALRDTAAGDARLPPGDSRTPAVNRLEARIAARAVEPEEAASKKLPITLAVSAIAGIIATALMLLWTFTPARLKRRAARIAKQLTWALVLVSPVPVVTYLAVTTLPAAYEARADVLVQPVQAPETSPRGEAQMAEFIASQVGILRARESGEAVARELDLRSRPEFDPALAPPTFVSSLLERIGLNAVTGSVGSRVLDAYFERLDVREIGGSWVIGVGFRSTDPKLAADAANAVADAYLSRLRTSAAKDAETAVGAQGPLSRPQAEARVVSRAAVPMHSDLTDRLAAAGMVSAAMAVIAVALVLLWQWAPSLRGLFGAPGLPQPGRPDPTSPPAVDGESSLSISPVAVEELAGPEVAPDAVANGLAARRSALTPTPLARLLVAAWVTVFVGPYLPNLLSPLADEAQLPAFPEDLQPLQGSIIVFGYIAYLTYPMMLRRKQKKLNTKTGSVAETNRFLLYLRPFITGRPLRVRCLLPLAVDRWLFGRRWDLELGLSLSINRQLVAVGDRRKTVGAAKLVTNDSTWRTVVDDLANRAAGLVVVPSDRAGMLWEVREIFRRPELLAKSVFIMPPSWPSPLRRLFMPWRRTIRATWRRTQKALGAEVSLPPYRRRGAIFAVREGQLLTFPMRGFEPAYIGRMCDLLTLASGPADVGELRRQADLLVAAATRIAATRAARILVQDRMIRLPGPRLVLHGLVLLVLGLTFRTFFFQPFNIPSGSMKETLLIGDYVFVNKFAYGYSRFSLPVPLPLRGRLFGGDPERGEVVTLSLPSDEATTYIKRIVGLPGDHIRVRHSVLYINDVAVPRVRLGSYVDVEDRVTYTRYRETMPNGASYVTLDRETDGFEDNTQEYIVPPGRYFVMGDNRDNSTDSRVPPSNGGVGYVPLENIVGRASFVFFSVSPEDDPAQVWNWPWIIRWDRLFTFLEPTRSAEAAYEAPARIERGGRPVSGVDINDCLQHRDADLSIAACSRVLDGNFISEGVTASAYADRGYAYMMKGDFARAGPDYEAALRLNPSELVALGGRGRMRVDAGDYRGALGDLGRAIQLDQKDAILFYGRGVARIGLGDRAGGIADMTKAIELRPTFAGAYLYRGLQYSATGKLRDAAADFDQTLRLDPLNQQALRMRGFAYTDLEKFDLALADLTQALKMDRADAAVYWARAWVLYKTGRLADGLVDAEKSLSLQPGEETFLETYGAILAGLGRRDEAITRLREALAKDPRLTLARDVLRELGATQ